VRSLLPYCEISLSKTVSFLLVAVANSPSLSMHDCSPDDVLADFSLRGSSSDPRPDNLDLIGKSIPPVSLLCLTFVP